MEVTTCGSSRRLPLMLAAGLELLVVGMGTVFAFLALMVLLMSLSSRVFAAISPPTAIAANGLESDDGAAEIAIALAVAAAHRRRAVTRG